MLCSWSKIIHNDTVLTEIYNTNFRVQFITVRSSSFYSTEYVWCNPDRHVIATKALIITPERSLEIFVFVRKMLSDMKLWCNQTGFLRVASYSPAIQLDGDIQKKIGLKMLIKLAVG